MAVDSSARAIRPTAASDSCVANGLRVRWKTAPSESRMSDRKILVTGRMQDKARCAWFIVCVRIIGVAGRENAMRDLTFLDEVPAGRRAVVTAAFAIAGNR
jgi:hypothetical protein